MNNTSQSKTVKSEPEITPLEQARKLALDDGYTLKDDVIQNLGKFEGEHVMTLYFYDAYMNGCGEPYDEDDSIKFNVTDEEAESFNISKGAQVILTFSDQGFVSSYINS